MKAQSNGRSTSPPACRAWRWALGIVLWWALASASSCALAAQAPEYQRFASWHESVRAGRAAWRNHQATASERPRLLTAWWHALQDDFPVECDWVRQDSGPELIPRLHVEDTSWERLILSRALEESPNAASWSRAFKALCKEAPGPEDRRWLELYVAVCSQRRAARLATLRARFPRIVFTRRRTLQPSFFAYTEGQSDAQNERHFLPGADLCLLELTDPADRVRTLLSDPDGMIRDPAVSWDGERVAFAWKRSLDGDDYHLYELETGTANLRQITSGVGFADYEPAYLPNGDLIFASTRCVQTVDCWWTEVSNLYTCDPRGRHLRRLGFDQVHTVYPQVLDDGRVIYTRWDYNDRGQVFPQPLFQMNPDGTGQTEFYANNSWFPTTIAHARGIPDTQRVLAILCGHHTAQAGKLAIIDPSLGRQENQGVQLVAPRRPTPAERLDAYGQSGPLWQYPYPLSEREFLVTYAPEGWKKSGPRKEDAADFAIYWMDVDGRRELLVRDPRWSCQQPVPLVPRRRPPLRPSPVDYRKPYGTYYMQDVYAGLGLSGIPRGTVVKLRVVGLRFRPAGVGNNGSSGPAGGALISTPIAVGNGTWDVKVVLGETPVQPDGSACFRVPARTPLYFQAIDAQGYAVQTMRSWSTLQPGEFQACVGCHESKNSAPPVQRYQEGPVPSVEPRDLEPFYGPPRGFSFATEIQPILDRHCTRCHDQRGTRPRMARLPRAVTLEQDPSWEVTLPTPDLAPATCTSPLQGSITEDLPPARPAFSLLGEPVSDRLAKRYWSDAYLNLTLAQPADNDWDRGSYAGVVDGHMVNWIGSQSIPAPLPPYAAGAARSALFPLLARGHYAVRLTRAEWDKLACWVDLLVPFCGDYTEAAGWTEEDRQWFERYAGKRRHMEALEQEHIASWQARKEASDAPTQSATQPGAGAGRRKK